MKYDMKGENIQSHTEDIQCTNTEDKTKMSHLGLQMNHFDSSWRLSHTDGLIHLLCVHFT